jgi:transposase-like protein
MNGKRKQHTAEVRFRVVLEALKGLKTVAELALTYEVHPTLVNRWKKKLQEGGRSLFGDPKRKKRETEVLQAALYEEIGRLKFELDWLKKKLPLSNSDQGVQFTSLEFTGRLETAGIAISMDGRGRALDNVFVERLWRSVNYEDMYIKDYGSVAEMEIGLAEYFQLYNHHRPHQSLNYQTPAWVHFQQAPAKIMG